MSTAISASSESAPPRSTNRRRRKGILAVVILVSAGLVTGVSLHAVDKQYGPIQGGDTGGPYTLHDIATNKFGFAMMPSTASGATAQAFELVVNNGGHSVKITSVTDSIVKEARWSIYRTTSHINTGDQEPFHRFPAIVPGHDELRLLLTIQRPSICRDRPESSSVESTWDGSVTVDWQSLLSAHTTTIDFPGDLRIQVC